MGFRSALRSMQPDRRVIDVTDTDGLDATIRGLVRGALKTEARVSAAGRARPRPGQPPPAARRPDRRRAAPRPRLPDPGHNPLQHPL